MCSMESTQTKSKWKKFVPQADKATKKGLTELDYYIIKLLDEYRFLPSSILQQLVPAYPKTTSDCLTNLYRKGLVNRFAFLKVRFHDEFIYYLHNHKTLDLYAQATNTDPNELNYSVVRYNRESQYHKINDPTEAFKNIGRMANLQHELEITKFHAMVELGCVKSGKVELIYWKQGSSLANKVQAPKVERRREGANETWYEQQELEYLHHEPDAFFTLRYPERPPEQQYAHFFLELDRGTEKKPLKVIRKLRAHFHFIVKQKLINRHYNIERLRAVLMLAPDENRMKFLHGLAAHPLVSGKSASPLFWFSRYDLFQSLETPDEFANRREKPRPLFLARPVIAFSRVWLTPAQNAPLSLYDAL